MFTLKALCYRDQGELDRLRRSVRVQTENARLRRECSLLREALRIKDARMERVPAERRRHYDSPGVTQFELFPNW